MNFKVLIVEDDIFINSVLNRALKMKDYIVHDVFDASTALKVLAQNSYHLVIIGLKTHSEDIKEIIKVVKNQNQNSGVIMIDEEFNKDKVKEYFDIGIDDLILKPLDFDLLTLKIKALQRRIKNSDFRRIVGDIEVNYNEQLITCEKNTVRLNPTEARIIHKLIDACVLKKVVTKEDINELLQQKEKQAGLHGAKVYIYRLRNKLSRVGAKQVEIKNDYGAGYYLAVNE